MTELEMQEAVAAKRLIDNESMINDKRSRAKHFGSMKDWRNEIMGEFIPSKVPVLTPEQRRLQERMSKNAIELQNEKFDADRYKAELSQHNTDLQNENHDLRRENARLVANEAKVRDQNVKLAMEITDIQKVPQRDPSVLEKENKALNERNAQLQKNMIDLANRNKQLSDEVLVRDLKIKENDEKLKAKISSVEIRLVGLQDDYTKLLRERNELRAKADPVIKVGYPIAPEPMALAVENKKLLAYNIELHEMVNKLQHNIDNLEAEEKHIRQDYNLVMRERNQLRDAAAGLPSNPQPFMKSIDRLFCFVAGLPLQDHPISEQRERAQLVQDLLPHLKPGRGVL